MEETIDGMFKRITEKIRTERHEEEKRGAEKKERERQEAVRANEARRKEIARLLAGAQANVSRMTEKDAGNAEFLKYITRLFENKADTRILDSNRGEADLVLSLATVKKKNKTVPPSATHIVLTTRKENMLIGRIAKDAKINVAILDGTAQHGMDIAWEENDLFWNGTLDSTLCALSNPEEMIRLLAKKFATADEPQ